jgi:hypothetical protein
MLPPQDIAGLLRSASDAIDQSKVRVSGGWSARPTAGRAYRAARFQFEGEPWAVCRGVQKPAHARLIDATASFMSAEDIRRGVALLDPPARPHATLGLPDDGHRRRVRVAAWHGLGIVWATSDAADSRSWTIGEAGHESDLAEIGTELERTLVAEADP